MESKRKFKKRFLPQEDQKYTKAYDNPINLKKNAQQNSRGNKLLLKYLKILFTNVDQLTRGKKHELENMVKKEKPHLIALCEVKSKFGEQKQLIEYTMDGYKVSNDTNIDIGKGRGIVILSQLSIMQLVMDIKCTVEFE